MLGHAADNTLGNALETGAVDAAEGFHSLRLVTASYHMPRSLLEFCARHAGHRASSRNPVFPEIVRRSAGGLAAGEPELVSANTTNTSSRWRGRCCRAARRGAAVILLRSLLFQLAVLSLDRGLAMLGLPLLLAPRLLDDALRHRLVAPGRSWLLRGCVGLDHEVRGREHLPRGPGAHRDEASIGLGHLRRAGALPDPAMVIKRELGWIPFYGWYALKAGMIAIDRAGGAAALKRWSRPARGRVAEGRPILIFPEGTRTAVGAPVPYQPGVAALYRQLDVPLVPVAVNSGLFWGRRQFLQAAGRIVVEILPPIPPGGDRRAVMARARGRDRGGDGAARRRGRGTLRRRARLGHLEDKLWASGAGDTVRNGHGSLKLRHPKGLRAVPHVGLETKPEQTLDRADAMIISDIAAVFGAARGKIVLAIDRHAAPTFRAGPGCLKGPPIHASVASISQQIWDMKYRLKGPDGAAVDKTIEDTWRRVATALAAPEREAAGGWAERFSEA